MAERRDVILGAGLAGLSAAYTLQKAGQPEWQVYERNAEPGGLARTMEIDGYRFDYGPHILFTIDDEIRELIQDLLGDNFHAQDREAHIYHHAHDLYTRFPFQAHLYGLPTTIVADCLHGLLRAVESQARGEFHPKNYLEWMRGFFGDGIADHLMVPYAKKIWTIDPEQMDFSWIGRRVPTPDVARIIRGALSNDVDQVGANFQFWYTRRGGIEPLPRALAARVENIHLERTAVKLELPEKQLVFEDGEVVPFRRLVYSLPLPFLPRVIANLPPEVERACAGLEYQGIHCINLGIGRERISDKHWIYYYEDLFPFHRVSLPANFSPDTVPSGKSAIATEVAFSKYRPLDGEAAVEKTVEALKASGLIREDDTIELVHTEEIIPAYVIYDLHHARNVETIRAFLRENDIWTVGRFGEWQYFNMDHSMRSGRRAAEEILALGT
ncbi:MAG: FAD-dependent oxidoreductase [Deltaproteobacteria bacterium]|nr:FAD-dependent oxidoreductase [Deltaproteobacteria bacterium]